MDDNPPDAQSSNRDNSPGPPLINTPLLTAVFVFIILPLLVVLLVLIGLLP
jgi:hypothetical protein